MSDLLEIGRIVKIQGLRGRIKAVSYLESKQLLEDLKEVTLRLDSGREQSYKVKKISIENRCFFLEFEGIEDPDKAGELVGSGIFVSASLLGQLAEGEYYWRQIIGLEVFSEQGDRLGKIESIFPTGSNEVYVCSGGTREILLPAIEDVIKKIDLENGRIIVRLPEGL